MALTISKVASYVTGDGRTVVFDATFDDSYPTGGESLTDADMGLGVEVRTVTAEPAGGLYFEYDYTNSKLVAKFPTGGARAPATATAPVATADSGGTTVTSSAATVPVALTAGIGLEVGDGTDLSRVTTRVTATGRGYGL